MIETIVKVDGMMCGMCESHVNEAVRKAFPEVKRVSSSQAKAQTVIHSEQPLDEQKLRDAINATGYEVKGVSSAPYEKKRLFLVFEKSKQTLTHIREAYLDEDSGLRCGRFGLRAGPCADAEQKKNVVTLLARGEWKEMIDQKGLVIRHWVQRKTTTERIKTVDTLATDDYYDLIFVVVQAGQLPDVLPVLKANKSQYFVFVGNNPQAKQVLEFMQRPADKIAFGFQGTAGRREHDHVVSVYASAGMTVGGATTPLSGTFRTRLKTAFDGAKYKLTFYGDMDEWLKCHIAFVLPACYVCYACNGDLHRATKQQRGAILDAAYEACLKRCQQHR